MQAVQINQNQKARILWTMRNQIGNPASLDLVGTAPTYTGMKGYIKVRFRESVNLAVAGSSTEVDGDLEEYSKSLLGCQVPAGISDQPGIYWMEWAVLDVNKAILLTNQGYLVVNRGQFGTDSCIGQPTIPEIRLHLRDSAPEDNYLLDETEWDIAELASCIERPVIFWNESQPDIGRSYTTHSFPFRWQWLEGIVACLYQMAAYHYRRNRAASAAAGVSLDDKNKSQEYELKGQQKWEGYRRWVQTKKAELNLDDGWSWT
jgi:hypothetical protein